MAVLLPMLLAVLSLGIFAVVIITRYIEDDMQKSNVNLLDSASHNISLIMHDLDLYSHSFSTDPNIIAKTKELLNAEDYDYDMVQSVMFIKNIIDTPVNTREYLISVYMCYLGYDSLLCSDLGLVRKEDFYDSDWLRSIEEGLPDENVWFQTRDVKRYSFEKEKKKIVAVNRKLSTPGAAKGDGIVCINLDAGYVEDMLNSLLHYDQQNILIVDRHGKIIFESGTEKNYDQFVLTKLLDMSGQNGMMDIEGVKCTVYKTELQQYGFSFFSVIPADVNYGAARVLIWCTLGIIAVVVCLSGMIAYFYTNKRKKQVMQIINILDEYERCGKIGESVARPRDEYELIVANILKTFVRNNEMQMQLAQRKYQMQVYELKALQAQINPHFLYNTLETLNWKAMELSGGHNIVNDMLENLGKIMKYCLSGNEKMISLSEEINYTKCYLAIQNIRYKNKFDMFWEYDEENLAVRVPKLFIQPLLENSIKHGVRNKEEKGKIKVKIFERNHQLVVTIIDNGMGMGKERLEEIKGALCSEWIQEGHIGLLNTHQRLRILYGEDYSIRINSKENRGTIITLFFPIQCENDCDGGVKYDEENIK